MSLLQKAFFWQCFGQNCIINMLCKIAPQKCWSTSILARLSSTLIVTTHALYNFRWEFLHQKTKILMHGEKNAKAKGKEIKRKQREERDVTKDAKETMDRYRWQPILNRQIISSQITSSPINMVANPSAIWPESITAAAPLLNSKVSQKIQNVKKGKETYVYMQILIFYALPEKYFCKVQPTI